MQRKKILLVVPDAVRWGEVFNIFDFVRRVNRLEARTDKSFELILESIASERAVDFDPGQYTADYTFDTKSLRSDLLIIPSIEEPLPENKWKNQLCMNFIRDAKAKNLLMVGTGNLLCMERNLSVQPVYPRTHSGISEDDSEDVDLRNWYRRSDRELSIASGQFIHFGMLELLKPWLSEDSQHILEKEFFVHPPTFDQRMFRELHEDDYHEDLMVQKAQEILYNRFAEEWNISELAKQLFISRRQFDRRFKKATGFSAPEYLRRIRIKRATQLIRNTVKPTVEISRLCGYSDADAFRTVFKSYFGCSPREYRTFFTLKNPEH